MPEVKTIEPTFPVSGVVRRPAAWGDYALSEKPFTPWSVNCRPEDMFEHRLRGGSRPGLLPYLYGGEPGWPTGELTTEGGEKLLDEDGYPLLDENGHQLYAEPGVSIVTEAGETIEVPITGASALYPDLMEAMRAYGYLDLPEAIVATVGTAPTGCTIGCLYRDRLVLAGEQVVYMSRQGDYTDWDYGADVEDAGRAFIFQLSEAGELGHDVTALIPHKDAVLMAATEYGLWSMKGDPAHEGSLRNVSRNVGIISDTAWTKADDTFFFLSRDGLYSVEADGGGLKDISGDRLPVELRDIDLVSTTVMLGYRHSESGVYIFLEGDQYHWFFDLHLGGFWPFNLPVIVHAAFVVDGELVVLDSTSQLWTFEGEDDDGAAVQSHVLIGPFRTQTDAYQNILTTISGAVETEPLDGGSVTWRIVTGDTAALAIERATDAVNNYVDGVMVEALDDVNASGTWKDGRARWSHPRVKAPWIVIWLQSECVWAFESMFLEMQPSGRWR